MRTSLVTVGLVLTSAALLRFWNLAHAPLSVRELAIVAPVVQLLRTGSYRPPALASPTLPIYLQALAASLHFMWGAVGGRWQSIAAFGPDQIVGWGRALSALCGTATVLVVYAIGLRWGSRHALLAAGLMAVMPADVAASREIGSGALLTLFAAVTLSASIAAIGRGGRRPFAIAGAASGLAAACHYAGALTMLMPLVAVWMSKSEESSRGNRALVSVGSGLAAFLVSTPLALADIPAFLNGFAASAGPTVAGDPGIHLLPWLAWTLQWPGLLLALGGLGLGVVRAVTGPGHTRWTVLVGFPVVYAGLLAWHGASSDAALLPLTPPAVLLAAIAVISGVSQLRRFEIPRPIRTALIAGFTVAAVLPPAVLSIVMIRQ